MTNKLVGNFKNSLQIEVHGAVVMSLSKDMKLVSQPKQPAVQITQPHQNRPPELRVFSIMPKSYERR